MNVPLTCFARNVEENTHPVVTVTFILVVKISTALSSTRDKRDPSHCGLSAQFLSKHPDWVYGKIK